MADNAKTATIWARAKPLAIALGIGLLVGPFVSNAMGWQVTSSVAKARVHSGVLEQHAMICAAKARAEVPTAAKLDRDARGKLAERMAVLPGVPEPGWEVTNACTDLLLN